MAANLVALRAALVCMGTTADVANEITATQGIDTIEVLRSTGHESREPMITPVKPLQTL